MDRPCGRGRGASFDEGCELRGQRLMLAFVSSAAEAEPATLAAYMDAAVENHPRTAIAAGGAATARADAADAAAALLPTMRGHAAFSYNQHEAIATFPDPAGGPPEEIVLVPQDQLQASLDLRVPLLDVPAWARWQGARLGTDLARAEAKAAEQDLRLDVARAWYAAVTAQQVVAAAERSKAAADENLRYLSIRAEAGAVTPVTVQRAELEVANAELLVLDSRRSWLTARRTLATLSGLPESEALPTAPAPETPLPPEDATQAAAAASRPELVAARARTDVLRTAAGAARLSYAPTVAGTASERITNASGFSGETASWVVGVELDWLLLEVGDRAADVRRARIALAVAEAVLRQAEDAVRDEVHAAWLDAEAALARVGAARRGAEVGRLAAEEVRTRFQAGTATQLEVIQAERDALDAEVARIRVEGELAVARLALQRAAGEPVAPD